MTAKLQRIEMEMFGDRPESDNGNSVLCSREQTILQQQTAQQFRAIVKRFLAKVQKTDTCWLWTASVMDAFGHGQFTIRDASGKQHHLYAHRVAWVLSGRFLARALQLCHKCDVPPCVRPGHLFPGTQRDNLNDAIAKGRLVCGLGARKLSDDAYRDILSTQGHGSGLELARKHGVSPVSISRIRHGHQGSTYHATSEMAE